MTSTLWREGPGLCSSTSTTQLLLLFDGLVEMPPIFIHLHDPPTWGAAVYNLPAIGACWIFAEFLVNRAGLVRTGDVPDAPSGSYQFDVARLQDDEELMPSFLFLEA